MTNFEEQLLEVLAEIKDELVVLSVPQEARARQRELMALRDIMPHIKTQIRNSIDDLDREMLEKQYRKLLNQYVDLLAQKDMVRP